MDRQVTVRDNGVPRRSATRQVLVLAKGQVRSFCGDPERNGGVEMGEFKKNKNKKQTKRQKEVVNIER